MRLLFEIREYIKNNPERYKEWFNEAYQYDEAIRLNKQKLPYYHDGCLYEIENNNDKADIKKIHLFKSDIDIDVNDELRYEAAAFRGKRYIYINELDHWISYLIIGFLKDKNSKMGSNLEKGLQHIKKKLIEEISNNRK